MEDSQDFPDNYYDWWERNHSEHPEGIFSDIKALNSSFVNPKLTFWYKSNSQKFAWRPAF